MSLRIVFNFIKKSARYNFDFDKININQFSLLKI